MKTKYFFLAALAATALAGCSGDDLIAEAPLVEPQETQSPILFSSLSRGMTRADFVGAEAAEKLNYQFVVSGFKGSKTKWDDNVKVFDNYLVSYKANTAHTTESNSDNWEYVGNTPIKHAQDNGIVSQTIKYWDYSRPQYDFIAWATGFNGDTPIQPIYDGTPDAGQVLVSAITPETATGDAAADASVKAYIFTGKAADLANCYISDLVTVKKPDYQKPVTMRFRALGSKVRIGIYETVPGYSVKDVKFYSAAATDDAQATVPKLFTTTANEIFTEGTYTIYFPTVDDESDADNNQAHIKFVGTGDQSTVVDFGGLEYTIAELGEKTEGSVFLGRTSNTASMAGEAEGNYYTQYLPNEAGTNLNLRVDYTLESTDGSGETILVRGATAQVPLIYTQWKAGYAYTYLFKISDKTNGHTGVYDPTNPDDTTVNSDPAGLYPITFDAVVVNAEDDATQETITTVSAPSITTYQNGSNVVNNNEYTVLTPNDKITGEIYVTVNDTDDPDKTPDLANGKLQTLTDKVALYTLSTSVDKEWTEAYVNDALSYQEDNLPEGAAAEAIIGRNGLLLTPATITLTNEVTYGVDGNTITVENDQAAKFIPEVGKTYAFVYTKTPSTVNEEIFQVVNKEKGESIEGLYRCGLLSAKGDVQKGVFYFTSLKRDAVTVFLGQTVNNLYLDYQGTTIASGYAKTGTDYYYTVDGGFNYIKANNVAYASFKDAQLYTRNGSGEYSLKTDVEPVAGTAYYVFSGTGDNATISNNDADYTYCVILPEQGETRKLYTQNQEVKVLATAEQTNLKAVKGGIYFDKYTKNNGVYYSKIIKVQ